MPQYFTSAGLDTLAQFESGGNPTAQNPNSSASGLYGFLAGTWAQFAPQAGVDINQYPTASSAPGDIQTQVAAITPITNWTCPGCDPGITNAILGDNSLVAATPASNLLDNNGQDFSGVASPSAVGQFLPPEDPGLVSAPNATLGNQIIDQYGNPIGALPGYDPSSGGTAYPTSSISTFWASLFSDIQNVATRFGLIILGIVLVAVGAWAAAHGEFAIPGMNK